MTGRHLCDRARGMNYHSYLERVSGYVDFQCARTLLVSISSALQIEVVNPEGSLRKWGFCIFSQLAL